jgi:CRISPR-associated protein (TIGR02710 family)
MPREIFLTVGTGRDREDIGLALVRSIRHHRPDRIWLLVTSKSQVETVPIIRRELGVGSPPMESFEFQDPDDAEACQRDSHRWLRERIAAGVSPSDLVVDYTSGTKAMSAGLFAAAVSAGVETISYVTGRRDEGGRVIPGSERFYSFTPRALFAQRDLDLACRSFDAYRFEAAAQLAAAAMGSGDPEILTRAAVLRQLAEAYGAWDRFDHARAFQILNELSKDKGLDGLHARDVVEGAKQFLHRAKANRFCPERLADLVANARRRHQEGKYDDAVARCYRGFEYLAQLRLVSIGLDPADLRWETVELKLPRELRSSWQGRVNEKGRLVMGLKLDYELLRDLGDPLGVRFCPVYEDRESPLRKRLEQRNNSILAHGGDPVSFEAAEELLAILEGYVREVVPQGVRLITAATFPRMAANSCRLMSPSPGS